MAIKMKPLEWVVFLLVSIGAINWGLTAIGFNLVETLLEAINMMSIAKWVYIAVGLSGVYGLYKAFKN